MVLADVLDVTDSAEVRRRSKLTCPAFQEFPRNQWYVVAFSQEVGPGTLLARRVLNQPVVLYRTEDGQPVALFDRCPHRGLPLSKGKLFRDLVQCGYHGFAFGADGTCREIPSQVAISQRMCVSSYPLIERWHFLWIWMGDPAQADPTLIPKCDALERSDMAPRPDFFMNMQANAELLHENLLDVTHITYLHPGQLDGGNIAAAPYRLESDGSVLRITRDVFDDHSDFGKSFGFELDAGLHRTLISETTVPNLNTITNIFRDPTHPELGEHWSIIYFPITPSGPRTCYNFAASARTHSGGAPVAGPADVKRFAELDVPTALPGWAAQDKDACEAIQQLFDELGPDAPEWSVKADVAALRCRQLVTDMAQRDMGVLV